MRKSLLLLGLAFLLGALAVAQEYPKMELFTGYTYVRINPGSRANAFNANGGSGQFQYNFNEALGFVADIGAVSNGNITTNAFDATGHATTVGFPGDQTQFHYLFGPRVTYHKTGKFSPFVGFEIGGIHNSRSFTVQNSSIPLGLNVPRGVTVEPGLTTTKFRSTQTALGLGVGGGLDIKVSRKFAVRPFQVEWLPTNFSPFNFSPSSGNFPNFNNTTWQHNFRYSGGVTFRFGAKNI